MAINVTHKKYLCGCNLIYVLFHTYMCNCECLSESICNTSEKAVSAKTTKNSGSYQIFFLHFCSPLCFSIFFWGFFVGKKILLNVLLSFHTVLTGLCLCSVVTFFGLFSSTFRLSEIIVCNSLHELPLQINLFQIMSIVILLLLKFTLGLSYLCNLTHINYDDFFFYKCIFGAIK